MEKPAKNLLIIMSDEHNPKVLGCAGHPIVTTPNLDRLAARGTRFISAYCASPVCIPARASFAVGKYVHQMGYWDNADAYDGSVRSWHHTLRDRGHEVVSIGKLHFRLTGEDHGFSEEIIPMHIIEGKGDLMGLVRSDLPVRKGAYKMANLAGPGESQYTFYDREIAARAQVWLREAAQRSHDKPWVLFVSFVAPHFPLTAPPQHFYKYYDQPIPLPKLYRRDERPMHPYLVDYRGSFNYDDYFDDAKLKKALAGYFGLCSFLDENIGQLRLLERMILAIHIDHLHAQAVFIPPQSTILVAVFGFHRDGDRRRRPASSAASLHRRRVRVFDLRPNRLGRQSTRVRKVRSDSSARSIHLMTREASSFGLEDKFPRAGIASNNISL